MPPPEYSRWFSEEVLPHEPSLRSYLRHSLRSLADVDDVLQECYSRVLRAKAQGGVQSSRAFLFAVARNLVRDSLRRRAVARMEEITEKTRSTVLEEGPSVVEFVSRREEVAVLREAIQALPDRCRQVFLLRRIQGLSQREVAQRLGITEATVESLVAKGLHRCADYLRKRGVRQGGF